MKILNAVILILSVAIMSACATSANVNRETILSSGIYKLTAPRDQLFSGGQPSKEQLKSLSESGVKHIINLRPKAEQSWNEQLAVEALGMKYHSLPVSGISDINIDNARAMAQILGEMGDDPGFLHCASGNRVGALMAVIEAKLKGQPVDSAIAEGRRWGLTRLAPLVRDKLSAP